MRCLWPLFSFQGRQERLKIGFCQIEKPAVNRPGQVVTAETWPKIRERSKEGDPFRNGLEFAWETGYHPEEVKKNEARFCRLEKHLGIKFCTYSCRRRFVTQKLEEGVLSSLMMG